MRIINFAFDPDQLVVPVGTTVTWRDVEGFHTVLSSDFLLDSPPLEEGQTYAHTFAAPGEYRYVCGIHPDMLGTITVR